MNHVGLDPDSVVAVSPYGRHYHLPTCRAVTARSPEADFYQEVLLKFARLIRSNRGSLYEFCPMCLGKE